MSFFASGMGAWVVYGTTEMGANPRLSWLGVLGYSFASALPGIFVMWLGPLIRDATKGRKAFSTTDFCLVRYGRVMQFSCAAISVFYMWVFLVAEFTSISNIYALIVGKQTYDSVNFKNVNVGYTTVIAVSIGVITVLYTGIGGLPSSIVTDKFQGIIMGGLVLLLTIAVCSVSENRISKEQFDLASNWTEDGFYAFVTLILAIISAELFNQATWQRVWAAKDTPSLRKGFGLGSFLVFLLMMFFGIMGMIGYAKEPSAYDNFEKYAYLAFFNILEPMGQGWHILVLIFVTSLAASSVDSLQNGITSLLSSDLLKISKNPELIKWMNRAVLVAVNISAVVKSAERFDVLGLFLVADIVCATAVFPVFLGLLNPEKFGIISPTEMGAFMGIIGGISAVLVSGVIIDSGKFTTDSS
jgi:SSS family solute:Na+ symporter